MEYVRIVVSVKITRADVIPYHQSCVRMEPIMARGLSGVTFTGKMRTRGPLCLITLISGASVT